MTFRLKNILGITILGVSILLITSCKPQDSGNGADIQEEVEVDPRKPQKARSGDISTARFDKTIPDACTLIKPEYIAKVMGIDKEAINIKDGSSTKNKKARSCFFKWDGDIPNGGILVQLMKNPVEDEFADWVTHFVANKKKNGEQSFTQEGVKYIYEDWNVVGDEGAFSAESGKYIWRVGNEMVFMLAFNLSLDNEAQKAAAAKLAPEIMKNFN
jgi:hypothetical protein